jgi:predicted ATPase/DNA-binding CsgD family transcriptional regulator
MQLIESLTRREQDILRLISEGLTDQQIAERLVLSLGTVKWYNKQIYGKLGVSNRTQASVQARALGLVEEQTGGAASEGLKDNLPASLTAFIGRKRDLAEMKRLLGIGRLLTITGVGGIGKTRLALEFARLHEDEFTGGVYFVPLAPLTAPENILLTIAEQLQFQFQQDKHPQQQLIGYLRSKEMLLVLDNYEHLLDNTVLVTTILQAAAGVKIITTSRERLNLYGEVVYTLGGLVLPEGEHGEDLRENEAIAFFVDCARRVDPAFDPDSDALQEAARICKLVGGMPLGIELAAPWIRVLSLAAIGSEIESGLNILDSGRSGQSGIHAAFERSWKLLTPTEQTMFMRASAFRGGFTREAAERVTGMGLPTLLSLVDKSLFRFSPDTGRYDIHELLRQYGAERLEASGDTQNTRDKHSRYYADFMGEREIDLKGRRQIDGLDEIEADFENIRVAWDWALQTQQHEVLHIMAEGLLWFGIFRSREHDVNGLFQHALAQAKGEASDYVKACIVARQCFLLPYHEPASVVVERLDQSLSTIRQHGDAREIAIATVLLGLFLGGVQQRDFQRALVCAQESFDYFQQAGDRYYLSHALHAFDHIYYYQGQRQMALQHAEEAIEIRRSIGDRYGTARILLTIAAEAYSIPDYEKSERYNQEVRNIWRELRSWGYVSFVNVNLAYLAIFRGDFEAAAALIEEALALATEVNHPEFTAYALAMSGVLASLEERYTEAWELLSEAKQLANYTSSIEALEWGLPLAACGLEDYETADAANRRALQFARRLNAPGRYLWHLPAACVILAHKGEIERTAEMLGLVFTHPASAPAWMEKWPLLARLRTDLEMQLGKDDYAAAWERGKGLDLEAVVVGIITA